MEDIANEILVQANSDLMLNEKLYHFKRSGMLGSVQSTFAQGSDFPGNMLNSCFANVFVNAPETFSNTSVNILSCLQENGTGGREQVKEEEESPTVAMPAKDKRKNVDQVTLYLTRRRIGDLMHFMMQHLLINEPDDPVEFLEQLMDKCLMFRSGVLCSPPLLFEDRHIAALYCSLDPLGMGFISLKQYHVGLLTLGLKKKEYEMEPELEADGSVSEQTFLTNAKMALVEAFMDMILLPPPMEDGESSLETFYH